MWLDTDSIQGACGRSVAAAGERCHHDGFLQELGVSVSTLERWRADARLQAVIATAGMEVTQRSAWCREQGIFPAELEHWRKSATNGVVAPRKYREPAADPR